MISTIHRRTVLVTPLTVSGTRASFAAAVGGEAFDRRRRKGIPPEDLLREDERRVACEGRQSWTNEAVDPGGGQAAFRPPALRDPARMRSLRAPPREPAPMSRADRASRRRRSRRERRAHRARSRVLRSAPQRSRDARGTGSGPSGRRSVRRRLVCRPPSRHPRRRLRDRGSSGPERSRSPRPGSARGCTSGSRR